MPQSLQRFKAEFFKALAHPTRIAILENLRDAERTVSELQALLGIEGAAVSQQLAVLRSRSIVEGRKVGANVIYRVPDPAVFQLLDVARAIFNNQLIHFQTMLAEQGGEEEELARSTPANHRLTEEHQRE